MTDSYDIFPKPQATKLTVFSAYSQYQRSAMAGYFVLTGCTVSRSSTSAVAIASGTFANGGVSKTYAGGSVTGITAASSAKHKIGLIYIDGADDTAKIEYGTEQTPSNTDYFLENTLPLPPNLGDEDWVVLALVRITDSGITDTTFGDPSYASGSVANIRYSGSMAVDNSTITISNGVISLNDSAYPNNIVQIGDKYIATDKVRARDGDGLKLGSENGEEIHIGEPGLRFDGSNDYVDSGTVNLAGVSALTAEFWIGLLAVPGAGTYPAILNHGTWTGNAGTFALFVGPTGTAYAGKLVVVVGRASGEPLYLSKILDLPPYDTRIHVVMTYDVANNAIKVFVNDAQSGTTFNPATALVNLISAAQIVGKRYDGAATLNMILYSERIWTRILSADEITDAYNGDPVSDTGLVLEYQLTEGSGGTLENVAGAANDGTLTNFADTKPGAGNFGTSGWVAGTQVDGHLAVSGSVGIDGKLHVEGDIRTEGDCAADSFTEFCKFPEGIDALAAIRTIKGDGKGGLDHSSLPDCVRVRKVIGDIFEERDVLDEKGKPKMDETGEKITELIKIGEEIEEGRDLGGTVSLLIKAVQELEQKVLTLENKSKKAS